MSVKKMVKNLFKLTRVNNTKQKGISDFEMERDRLIMGKILTNQVKTLGTLENILVSEFKVFSQMGDDGIIQYLINNIAIPNETFIEFGVENYSESNTRFLLMNNNWSGMVIDGSEANVNEIRNSYYYWKYDLKAIHAFIDADNIELLIDESGFGIEIGILSIDIDGNDYWIWKKISTINPIIVIAEFNSVFGIDKPWTVPYDPSFLRSKSHHSNLFYGSSLLSLCDLAEAKGYYFVGCNSAGNNSYFIRKDKIGELKILKPEVGYVSSKFAESRSKEGALTLTRGTDRIKLLKGMEVYNTRTEKLELIA